MPTGVGMRAPELLAMLNRIEAEVPVSSWQVDGLQAWPLARGQIAWRAQRLAATDLPDTSVLESARAVGRQLRLSPSPRPLGQRDLVFLANGVASVTVAGRPYDRHCGPIAGAAARRGLSTVLLDPGPGVGGGADARVAIGPLLVAAKGVSVVAPRVVRSDPPPGWLATQQILAEAGHPDLLRWPSLRRHAAEVRVLTAWFRRVLQRTRPKAVFVVGLDLTSFAMCLACDALGVRSIEIQHGLQGGMHWSYARWAQVPPRGWTLLPDRFWVWTDDDAASIRTWAGDGGHHQPIVGGNVWLRRCLDDHDGAVQARAPSGRASLRILVTLQTGFSTHPGVRELIRVAGGLGACVVLRLHPTMSQVETAAVHAMAQAAGLHVEDPQDRPLLTSLLDADVHVTVTSASVAEAAVIGVGSVVVDPLGPLLFEREHSMGLAETWVAEEAMAPVLHRMAAAAGATSAPPPIEAGLDALGL